MASAPPDDLRQLDVLIVDDAPSVRQTVADMVADMGVPSTRIYKVESAREALIFCDSQAPDLLLLDLVLPDIPGEEVGSVLMDDHPEMRVVPMTALDPEDGRVRQLVALGAFDVLQKPVRRREVEELFEEFARETEAAASG